MPNKPPIPNLGNYLGKNGYLPNSTQANKALAVLNADLAKDVPFGLGTLFAQLEQSGLDQYGHLYNITKTGDAQTQTDVAGVQSTLDAAFTGPGVMFGFQQIADALQGIWNWNDSQSFFTEYGTTNRYGGYGGAIIFSQCMLRLASSTAFLVRMNGIAQSEGFPDVEDLNAAQPALKPHSQSVLDYLNATLPAYSWEENHLGTGLVGMTFISATDGFPRDYWWSPLPPSLDDIWHLWDYTPSSGPPMRNGIQDFIQFLTLVPIQWS